MIDFQKIIHTNNLLVQKCYLLGLIHMNHHLNQKDLNYLLFLFRSDKLEDF